MKSESLPNTSNQFSANVVWMDETPMQLHNNYIFKFLCNKVKGMFINIINVKDINNFDQIKKDKLNLNDIGNCILRLDQHVTFDSYYDNHLTGSFIVIDQITNKTSAAGMILTSVINQSNQKERIYSDKDRELNEFVRKNFPEWGCKAI